MSGADDLFASETAAKPVPDRLGRAAALLAIATPLNLLGIACFTGVPGAVLALLAWQTADEEIGRVESGALPADRLPRARKLRDLAFGLLGFAVLSLGTQLFLFWTGMYTDVVDKLLNIVDGG